MGLGFPPLPELEGRWDEDFVPWAQTRVVRQHEEGDSVRRGGRFWWCGARTPGDPDLQRIRFQRYDERIPSGTAAAEAGLAITVS